MSLEWSKSKSFVEETETADSFIVVPEGAEADADVEEVGTNQGKGSLGLDIQQIQSLTAQVQVLVLDNKGLKEQIESKNNGIRSAMDEYKSVLEQFQSGDQALRVKYNEIKDKIANLKQHNSLLQKVHSNFEIQSKLEHENDIMETELQALEFQLQESKDLSSLLERINKEKALILSLKAQAQIQEFGQGRRVSQGTIDQEIQNAIEAKGAYEKEMEDYTKKFYSERVTRAQLKNERDELSGQIAEVQMKLEAKEAEIQELRISQINLTNQHIERNTTRNPNHSSKFPKLSSIPTLLTESLSDALGLSSGSKQKRTNSKDGAVHSRSPGPKVDDDFTLVFLPNGNHPNPSAPLPSESNPRSKDSDFECPFCTKKFPRFEPLVTHVDSCSERAD